MDSFTKLQNKILINSKSKIWFKKNFIFNNLNQFQIKTKQMDKGRCLFQSVIKILENLHLKFMNPIIFNK